MKEVIFILLNGFADWEGAYVAVCLNQGVKPGNPVRYQVKTLSLTKDPVVSGYCPTTHRGICRKIMPVWY